MSISINSLWGEDFNTTDTKKTTKKVLSKITSPKTPAVLTMQNIKSKKISNIDKLKIITENVLTVLGMYKDNTVVIYKKNDLVEYINKSIKNGIISIDTETNNSLDPISCKIMGLCLYTPGEKNAYVPINHVFVDTGERLNIQLTEQYINEQLNRLTSTNIIMHNGKFDYQVIKCTCGNQLKIYWDTMIAAKILNENELSAGLKQQYIDKIDPSSQKYSIDYLFENIPYEIVDPAIFALYSATDAYMTYKLYEWQKAKFKLKENLNLYNLFMKVEMPVIEVIAEMELTGVTIDMDYSDRLSKKYHNMLDEVSTKITNECNKYADKIRNWRLTAEANNKPLKKKGEGYGKSKNEQLEDPFSTSSPTQFAIFLYDILKLKPVDIKNPRGTGEEILKKIDLPICKLILEQRSILKLLNAFIDALPTKVSSVDNRLHAHFNQYGAQTGRFSSSDPNLQQIPSYNKEIRMMFKAQNNYKLVGADFSQQEPRLLSYYSQDDNMINAYKQDKDLYSIIASSIYHNDYWDNMEYTQAGIPNPDGKKRRSSVKRILLGIMYGRGITSIAEQIGGTLDEAQNIINTFYKSFPKVKNWIDETSLQAKKLGYVEDFAGRRRRLPDILLPNYTISIKEEKFNPLLNSSEFNKAKLVQLKSKYSILLEKCRNNNDFKKIKELAEDDNIILKNNKGFINQAERQCVNARIQGGAASMTKVAMRKVYDDPELNRMKFKLLICVHDELIGECPEEYANECGERLSYIMSTSVSDIVNVPFKCDSYIVSNWYEDEVKTMLRKKAKEEYMNNKTINEIYDDCLFEHSELTREKINEFLQDILV